MKEGEDRSRGQTNCVLPMQGVCGRIQHKERAGQAHKRQAHLHL